MSATTPRPSAIERLPAVLERTGIGRSTLYALMSRGEFPSPVQLSIRAVGWRSTDVDSWLSSRVVK